MQSSTLVLVGSLLLQGALSAPTTSLLPRGHLCPPFSGSFNISNFQLYPENADFDSIHCKLYASANFNASVLVYDPYTAEQSIITLPGITGVDPYHVSGIDFDSRTGIMYFSANSGNPFVSGGSDLSGPNKLVKYNTSSSEIIAIVDMANFQAAAQAQTGQFVSGFQDQATDANGNTYYLATYGPAIAKVTPDNQVSVFWATNTIPNNVLSYNGLVIIGNKIVTLNNVNSALQYLDITASNPQPVNVTVTGVPADAEVDCDGIYAPPEFRQTVVLCSSDGTNSLIVYHSNDGWNSAAYLGNVANPLTADTVFPTASVQIAQSIYMVEEYFFDSGVFDIPGDRAIFPFSDVTSAIDQLVSAANK
ncbi:hypothetical protein F5884DRAFT_513870 [Xylogone sp. PMI_703]|nr:hypothetical protein F5884DRAFT_513870 [Xylogone sp. PMI_703]